MEFFIPLSKDRTKSTTAISLSFISRKLKMLLCEDNKIPIQIKKKFDHKK